MLLTKGLRMKISLLSRTARTKKKSDVHQGPQRSEGEAISKYFSVKCMSTF
jgi:hypothetical protein